MSSISNTFLKSPKAIGFLCNGLTNLTLAGHRRSGFLRNIDKIQQTSLIPISSISLVNFFHTTSSKLDIMEFFDNKKNWGENEIKCGRAWTLDELRIKSNSDLHKLWYILLKERNMLKTMEHECNEKLETFPNPERIDKVQISMDNLESVVRERNKAYFELETGETGEQPKIMKKNALGLQEFYRAGEYLPVNLKQLKSLPENFGGRAVRKFLLFYREKQYNEQRKAKNRDRNHVKKLLRRFPDLDLKLIKEKYPSVDLKKMIDRDDIRGHFVPKLE